jgi:hypothetical protein
MILAPTLEWRDSSMQESGGSELCIHPHLRHSILIEVPGRVCRQLELFFQGRLVPLSRTPPARNVGTWERQMVKRKIISGDYISRGRKLSLSKAIRAGDFV